MQRETDFTHPNPPDDIPSSPLMNQAMGAFRLPWPRKPLSGKPKATQAKGGRGKSGLQKFKQRVSHGSPYF